MTTQCRGPSADETATCTRAAVSEGLCLTHYQQARRCRLRGEPVVLTPILLRGDPKVTLSIRLRRSTLRFLGAGPSERAREILEKAEHDASVHRPRSHRRRR